MFKQAAYLKIILRGVSQVMLQKNSATGLLFLCGIFYNSWLMGIGALLGVLASTIIALILHYKKDDVYDGLYGFNGTLVGITLVYFFNLNLLSVLAIILGSFLSTLIINLMFKIKLPPYTFPFVLSTWFFIILIKFLNLAPLHQEITNHILNLNIASSLSMGFGQVMFQANIITGIIFFIAILINSRQSAFYGIFGSLAGLLLAFGLSAQINLINIGIFGFNGVLCGIAFADKKKFSIIYALSAIVLSVFIIYGMLKINLIALTSPFVFSTWIILLLRTKINKPHVLQTQDLARKNG